MATAAKAGSGVVDPIDIKQAKAMMDRGGEFYPYGVPMLLACESLVKAGWALKVRDGFYKQDLRRAKAATKMGAESPATKNGMAKKRRKLTSTERKTIEGRFAVHLRALMDAKGWQVGDLHEQLTRFAVDIEKPAIHVWLRGKSLPKAKFLEPLGRALGLKDYREVLPPPVE